MSHFQVECKKAQPKEVMLPANLAKTRAAGRGAYGESKVPPSAAPHAPQHAPPMGAGPQILQALPNPSGAYRYAPYTIPNAGALTLAGNQLMLPASHQLYNNGTVGSLQAKRLLAATMLRPQPHTLTYSMNDLIGVQAALELPSYFHPATLPAAIGI